MFWNLNQYQNHASEYFDALVDLKVVGWKSYAKATDKFTGSFFTKQLDEATTSVEELGEKMKKFAKGVSNVK